jgi:hypothetical protein
MACHAREHYHRGDLIAAWRDIQMAEGCIIVGNREFTDNRRLSDEIDRAM